MFANRLKKNVRRVGDWARRNKVTCYRIYDGDIPEIPLSRIDPVPAMLGQSGSSMTESLVRPDPGAPGRDILVVLSLEAIMRRLATAGAAATRGGDTGALLPRAAVA